MDCAIFPPCRKLLNKMPGRFVAQVAAQKSTIPAKRILTAQLVLGIGLMPVLFRAADDEPGADPGADPEGSTAPFLAFIAATSRARSRAARVRGRPEGEVSPPGPGLRSGGNSIRAGGGNLRALLDQARRLGMSVTLGYPVRNPPSCSTERGIRGQVSWDRIHGPPPSRC